MLIEVKAGPFTLRGVSVAGVYTSIQVSELKVLLDTGLPLRSIAATDDVFLSHGHADHASGLASVLGIRALIGKNRTRIFLPAEIVDAVRDTLRAASRLHRCTFEPELIGMSPGDERVLRSDLLVRAFRTHHTVPSLGYLFLRRVQKLRPEFQSLPGPEIGRRRAAGDLTLFESSERLELAYITDSLSSVLESSPEVLDARVLIVECTYVGRDKTAEDAQARSHIHLDELIARADCFRNEAIVLMHFSQGHSVGEVRRTLDEQLPASLRGRVVPFLPEDDRWFG